MKASRLSPSTGCSMVAWGPSGATSGWLDSEGRGQKGRPSISQYFAAWTTGNTCSKAYMPWSAVRSRSRPDFQSAELPYSNVKKWRVQSADESPYFILGPSLASSASPPSPPSPTCPVLGTCSPLSAPVPLR